VGVTLLGCPTAERAARRAMVRWSGFRPGDRASWTPGISSGVEALAFGVGAPDRVFAEYAGSLNRGESGEARAGTHVAIVEEVEPSRVRIHGEEHERVGILVAHGEQRALG
jgi:hypothetical protein